MDNYKPNQFYITDNWICPDCKGTETQFSLRIIPTGKPIPYPKFIIQIKESCSTCGRYKRFAPQTDILVDRFNQRLQAIRLDAKPGRDGF